MWEKKQEESSKHINVCVRACLGVSKEWLGDAENKCTYIALSVERFSSKKDSSIRKNLE